MISAAPLPSDALLQRYVESHDYADCYCTDVDGDVTQSQFVLAFYTAWLFKLERLFLKYTVFKPSTDTQARQLADGNTDRFSAWSVEARTANQLVMCDYQGRTRSWLMAVPVPTSAGMRTRLYFGTAIVRRHSRLAGKRSLGIFFMALLPFHWVYSRALLRTTRSHVVRLRGSPRSQTKVG
jgi:hypothetical protein